MDTIKLDSRKTLANEMADQLREFLQQGNFPPDKYLPPERELGVRYKISRVTVRRGLMQLVKEGWLEAIPSKGYRPTSPDRQGQAPRKAIYITGAPEGPSPWPRTEDQLVAAFQHTLIAHGMSAVGMSTFGRDPDRVFADLAAEKVWGVMLDTSRADLIAAAERSGLPCVLVNAVVESLRLDAVIQDNYGGVRQLTQHLVAQGHRKVGYVGPTRKLAHYHERYAGYLSALHEAGLAFRPDWVVELEQNEMSASEAASFARLLKRADRPEAFVAPWLQVAIGAKRACDELGLPEPKRPALAAWANEDEYRTTLAPEFLAGAMPVTAVWRLRDMAELALDRLRARSESRNLPVARIDVPVRIVPPQSAETALKPALPVNA